MNIKKMLVGATAGTLMIVGIVTTAFASAPNWNVSGTSYVIDFTCVTGCLGVYTHTMNIGSMNTSTGDFSGTGVYNADSSYIWNVNGNVSSSNITFHIVYTGANPGYTIDGAGIIAGNGSISGTASSSSQTFTFQSTSGAATLLTAPTKQSQCKDGGWKTFNNPTFKNQEQCEEYVESHKVTPGKADGDIHMGNPKQRIDFEVVDKPTSNDKGKIEYWNYDYSGVLHYKSKALCVYVNKTTKESRFMFQIPNGHPGLSGLYVVSYVKDNGNPGTSDLYGHNATGDLTTAQTWCENGTGFTPTMYPITSGNVVVH